MSSQDDLKRLAALEALKYVRDDEIIGIGSGSTVNIFIEELGKLPFKPKGAIAASLESEKRLKDIGIDIYDANSVSYLDLYIDGADEVSQNLSLIKGGGAALTREKIIASIAKKFICIVDESKIVPVLGRKFPLPIEVIPMARSAVSRKIVTLGGAPNYRSGTVTDNGNQIIDVENFPIVSPQEMETKLNNIPGVVTNGLFALRGADIVIIAKKNGSIEVKTLANI